jgi:HEAT repeat protein
MSDKSYRRQLKTYIKHFHALKHYGSLVEMLETLLASQQPIVKQLRMMLTLDDVERVENAISVIGWLKISEFTAQLIALYEAAQDNGLPWTIVTTLGLLENEQAYQFLLTILQDSLETQSRILAAYGLQSGKHPDAVAPLLALAQNTSEDARLRGQAIEALAYQGDKWLLPQILPFLQDSEIIVRWDALYTVGRLGDTSYRRYVEPLLNDTAQATNIQSIADEAREVLDAWTAKST